MQVKRWIPRIIAISIAAGGVAFSADPEAVGSRPDTDHVLDRRGQQGHDLGAGHRHRDAVRAPDHHRRRAGSPGASSRLHADFNEKVKKGQIIAKLDEQLLKENIDQQQAAYDLAVANEKKAEVAVMDGDRQYKRQIQLQKQQLIAAATVEAAEVTYKSAVAAQSAARASVSQALANLKQAQINLGYATITSPVDGIVLSRAVEVGQTVQSSMTAPTLFTIAEDLSHMQIDTSVAESDVGRLAEGMKATFAVDAFPGQDLRRHGAAGPQLADHDVRRRHVRLGDRRRQRRRGRRASASSAPA